MKKRSLFWDNYKGIFISLVVLGHFLYAYSLKLGSETPADIINTIIHMVHMPAFVFCSGYLSKSDKARSKAGISKLILLYAIFNGIMLLYKFLIDGSSGSLLTPHQTVWYLLSLIWWRLIIDDIAKIKGIIPITIAITLLSGFWSELGTDVLSIRRTIAFFVFFVMGYKLDTERIEHFLENRSKKVFIWGGIAATLFLALVIYIATAYNSFFPISNSLTYDAPYGKSHNIYTRIIIMAIALVCIVLMFMIIPNRRIPLLTKWGKNSLPIFVCHRIITLEFTKFFPYKSFEPHWYIYIFAAWFLTCLLLGSDRFAVIITKNIDIMAEQMSDENNAVGNVLKTLFMVFLVIIMALIPYINSIR